MARTKKKAAAPSRFDQLRAVAEQFRGWSPPREVLTTVRAVPTVFPQLDVATRCGGWPTQRLELLHGPSNHGKSAMLHGLGLSFLRAGGFYALVDAEFTTDDRWLEKLVGAEMLEHPGFWAQRPRDYEQVVDAVRSALDAVATARHKGTLDDDAPLLLGVDSLVKLVPKDLLAKVLKELEAESGKKGKGGGVDGARGRGAMIQALWNSAWFKGLTSQLYEANASMTVITRESENPDKRGPYDKSYKLRGGMDVQFESSLTARVQRDGWVKAGEQVVGERHRVEISKTKVGGKDDRTIVCYFHSSNGVAAPEGFWRARDVVDLALEYGALRRSKNAVHDAETGEEWPSVNECVEAHEAVAEMLHELEQRARQAATEAIAAGKFTHVVEPAKGAEEVFDG